jgi:hypothetical protein
MQYGDGILLQLRRMTTFPIVSFSWAEVSALCFLLFFCIALLNNDRS